MSPPIEVVGVVMPARDEATLLPRALAALGETATVARRRGVTVDLLVVADSCSDGTAEVARAAGVRVLEVSAGAVGPARAAGLDDILLRHPAVPRDRLWLASTDADSQVPSSWLSVQIDLAAAGADLVLGTVEVDDWSEHPTHVELAWRAAYDPSDGHGHIHGANVGARADAYIAVGGFPAVGLDEDVALAAALAHRTVVRTGAIPVLTSARVTARARGGFADHLAELAELA